MLTGGGDHKEIYYVQKYSREKITHTQNPNTPGSHYHTIKIILQKNTKDRNTNSYSFDGI
jgi:hypothetical protein